ncbi:hypothetical protein [Microbacterium sp.]|nr:hypothetical protein [Microbacterium sp.]
MTEAAAPRGGLGRPAARVPTTARRGMRRAAAVIGHGVLPGF